MREVDESMSVPLIRRAWPIHELHPNRRQSQLPIRLARHCKCVELQLSRDPAEFIDLVCTIQPAAAIDMRDPITVPLDDDLAMTPWSKLRPVPGWAA
jgi:hypothetical protein